MPSPRFFPSKCMGACCALALFLAADAAFAQDAPPDYRDDRSTPEAVIESLYNAIDRGETLRAWSYFRDEPDRPSFEAFAKGYEATTSVRLKLGAATNEGAAGSIYFSVPAAIEATARDGGSQVFTGCYTLRLVQPAAQITPPFVPMGIVKGTLKKSSSPFETAAGACPDVP